MRGFETRGNGGLPPFQGVKRSLVLPPSTGAFIKWGIVAVAIVALLVGLNLLRGIYTDWLWFDNLGYLSVFTTILWTRVWLFIVGAGLFGGAVVVNIVLARRFSRGESVLPLPAETLYWLNRLTFIGVILAALLLSIIFGSILAGRWETILKFLNASSFGAAEPVFDRDVSFYVFTLPVLNLVQGWLLGALIVLLLAVVSLYFIYYTLRGQRFVLTPRIRGHLAVLGSLIFFNLAANHFIDRFDLLFSSGGATFGASYTDVHARLTALLVLTVIATASGALLLMTLLPALRGARGTRLIFGAVGLWLGSALLIGGLYPSSIQRFIVEPNELKRETLYIERNIRFTRAAFGLSSDRIQEETISVREELPPQSLFDNPETVNNVRLWDPLPLRNTYNQVQFLRLYYSFRDVDVDRYVVEGQYRQVLIGARELQPENLPVEAPELGEPAASVYPRLRCGGEPGDGVHHRRAARVLCPGHSSGRPHTGNPARDLLRRAQRELRCGQLRDGGVRLRAGRGQSDL